jgi:hypothetical protein
MRQARNQTVTRIALKELTCIVIKQWPDNNRPAIAEPLIPTDWTPAIYFLTTEFV